MKRYEDVLTQYLIKINQHGENWFSIKIYYQTPFSKFLNSYVNLKEEVDLLLKILEDEKLALLNIKHNSESVQFIANLKLKGEKIKVFYEDKSKNKNTTDKIQNT